MSDNTKNEPSEATKRSLARHEHEMWSNVVAELRAAGVEINDHDRLCKTLELWGEYLVNFRLSQTPTERVAVLSKRTDAYLNAIVEPELENGSVLRVVEDQIPDWPHDTGQGPNV